MVLETTECISISNKSRNYTDCMEFSLLRFLQLIAHCPKQIALSGKCGYSDKINTGLVGEFIQSNPEIYQSAEYYLSPELPGPKTREQWAQFVSDRDFLDYYRNDSAELFTSVENIIKFFNGFYNLNLDVNDIQSSLEAISNQYTTDHVKLRMQIESVNETEQSRPMYLIRQMISRPDDEYKSSKKNYKVKIKNTVIDLSINSSNYKWKLYEVYIGSNDFINKYITGHSVIEQI